jgi:ECF sigma factor
LILRDRWLALAKRKSWKLANLIYYLKREISGKTAMLVVYEEPHRLAHPYMAAEQPGRTLQTTALVNEVYLRLVM